MKSVFVIAAAAALFAGAALAAEPTVTFNAGAVSDYQFRGVSQSKEDPAYQAGADLASGIVYGGVWASTVSFAGDSKTKSEIDLYGGVRPVVGDLTFDVGVVYYTYPGAPSGADYNYVEAKFGVSKPFGKATLGANLYYSPDFFGGTDKAIYVEAYGSAPLTDKLSISGGVGRQDVDYDGDYTTWNLGVTYALTKAVSADVRYVDTDGHKFGDVFDSRVIAGLKVTF